MVEANQSIVGRASPMSLIDRLRLMKRAVSLFLCRVARSPESDQTLSTTPNLGFWRLARLVVANGCLVVDGHGRPSFWIVCLEQVTGVHARNQAVLILGRVPNDALAGFYSRRLAGQLITESSTLFPLLLLVTAIGCHSRLYQPPATAGVGHASHPICGNGSANQRDFDSYLAHVYPHRDQVSARGQDRAHAILALFEVKWYSGLTKNPEKYRPRQSRAEDFSALLSSEIGRTFRWTILSASDQADREAEMRRIASRATTHALPSGLADLTLAQQSHVCVSDGSGYWWFPKMFGRRCLFVNSYWIGISGCECDVELPLRFYSRDSRRLLTISEMIALGEKLSTRPILDRYGLEVIRARPDQITAAFEELVRSPLPRTPIVSDLSERYRLLHVRLRGFTPPTPLADSFLAENADLIR